MAEKVKRSYDSLPEGALPIIEDAPKSYEQLPLGAIPLNEESKSSGGPVSGAAGGPWTVLVQGTGKRLPNESAEDHLARLKAADEFAKGEALKSLFSAASAPLWHTGLISKFIGGGAGALTEGLKNAISEGPSLYKAGIAGYVGSHLARPIVGPEYAPTVGAGIAAAAKAPAFTRGAIRGFKSGFQGTPVPRIDFLPPAERVPIWVNSPEGTIPVPSEVEPILSKLPSGRQPGGLKNASTIPIRKQREDFVQKLIDQLLGR